MSKVVSFCISAYYKLRKPSTAKVARLIAKEGWTVNCPRPEDIVQLWRPAPKKMVEDDSLLIRRVSEQTWTGLAIKDFGPPEGLGKKTFHFSGQKKQ